QAEDGIRDYKVTGVQTCALPILLALMSLIVAPLFWFVPRHFARVIRHASREKRRRSGSISSVAEESFSNAQLVQAYNRQDAEIRSEERRVGKGCGARRWRGGGER